MPANEIVVNGSKDLTYIVPDSFMPPLMEYLKMVKEKTELKGACETEVPVIPVDEAEIYFLCHKCGKSCGTEERKESIEKDKTTKVWCHSCFAEMFPRCNAETEEPIKSVSEKESEECLALAKGFFEKAKSLEEG